MKFLKPALRILTLTALSLGLLYGVTFSGIYHKLFMRKIQGSNVVAIYNPLMKGMGTGFHVKAKSGKVFIMTNAHVCKLKSKGMVLVKDNAIKSLKGELRKVIYEDKQHDLCLVESKSKIGLKLASDRANPGDRLYIVGHPRGLPKQIQEGELIADTTIEMVKKVPAGKEVKDKKTDIETFIQIITQEIQNFSHHYIYVLHDVDTHHFNLLARPGNSGSPIFNIYGNVVSVLFAGQRGVYTNTYGVPYHHIKRVLDLY